MSQGDCECGGFSFSWLGFPHHEVEPQRSRGLPIFAHVMSRERVRAFMRVCFFQGILNSVRVERVRDNNPLRVKRESYRKNRVLTVVKKVFLF